MKIHQSLSKSFFKHSEPFTRLCANAKTAISFKIFWVLSESGFPLAEEFLKSSSDSLVDHLEVEVADLPFDIIVIVGYKTAFSVCPTNQ